MFVSFVLLSFLLIDSCRCVVPVVLFHGLNSTCCEGKTLSLSNQIKDALPDIYIHSVRFGKDATDDRLRTLFGDLDRQVSELCRILKEDDQLQSGFNAIGLSQVSLLTIVITPLGWIDIKRLRGTM